MGVSAGFWAYGILFLRRSEKTTSTSVLTFFSVASGNLPRMLLGFTSCDLRVWRNLRTKSAACWPARRGYTTFTVADLGSALFTLPRSSKESSKYAGAITRCLVESGVRIKDSEV